jgi:hypothetical protein
MTMRSAIVSSLLLFAFVASPGLLAQTNTGPVTAQKQPQQYYAPDGGVTETLESIFIPPKAEAPFTLMLETEWVKTLGDGGTITLVNKRRIARDSKGRIYQERWLLVPKSGKYESRMNVIQISDPLTHTLYNCFQNARHECVRLHYGDSSAAVYKASEDFSGDLPDGAGSVKHEALGKQLLEGIEASGSRDRITYNPGVFGNDNSMIVERESWYSERLGINMLSINSDPRFGKQTFRATNLTLSEPDPSLFELPQGFKAVERAPTATDTHTTVQ